MKRFWREVRVAGRQVLLDGRPLRTPARAELVLPSDALATAVGEEWRQAGEEFDPRAMPLTGLANAAVDRVAPQRDEFVATLARYAEGDLLCYRAETPPELARAEAAGWDPLLAWARGRYDIAFVVTAGIVHRPQPEATVARLAAAVEALDAFRLAALQPLVTIGGSLVIALGVLEGAVGVDAGFDAGQLDELWQAAQWGEDALAAQARSARRRDWLAAARFLELLQGAEA